MAAPPPEADWAAKFALVDAAFGFLSRHRATPSVRNVVRMAESLRAGAVSASDLRRMAALAPELLTLDAAQPTQLQHRDDIFRARELAADELELLAFPPAPQASARASDKRKKLFAAALAKATTGATTSSRSREGDGAAEAAATTAPPPRPPPATPCSPWVAMLQSLDIYTNQLVHVETRAARSAQFAPLASLALPAPVVAALAARGIRALYSHQHAAIAATLRGDNVVLSTSTASGKSLAFTVPTLAALVREPRATSLYLFPTKALAQDQLGSLRRLLHASGLPERLCATFDGDTPMASRSAVVRDAQIFLTNPDTMHLTILPRHAQWKTVLANLTLLVVDEAHMYRGVFGAHVANVFRRLFRLCARYGANPRVVCCSATVRNPESHFRMLLPTLPPQRRTANDEDEDEDARRPASFDFFYERPLRVITEDGAPTGAKVFCVWNPKAASHDHGHGHDAAAAAPPAEPQPQQQQQQKKTATAAGTKRKRPTATATTTDTAAAEEKAPAVVVVAPSVGDDDGDDRPGRAASPSAISQSAAIFARLVRAQVHTLLFCRGRKLSELVLMNVHAELRASDATRALVHRVHAYRGGYSAADRRRIERQLFDGELLGVVATNALELGIDVGELDCTMHLGLPASVSSLWQQAGRAGRKAGASLAVIVCFDAPLDQHFARHGDELLALRPEAVTLRRDNRRVLAPHLLCAAHEFPLWDARSGLQFVDAWLFGGRGRGPHETEDDTEDETSVAASLLRELALQQQLVARPPADGGGFQLHSCALASARSFSLRSIGDVTYEVVTDDGEQRVLDTVPGETVFFQVYPSAVYLHQACEYLITRLDVDAKVAFARRCAQPLTYFTTCRDATEVDVVKVRRRRPVGDEVAVCEGDVSVATSVFGATLLEKKTMRVLHTTAFSLPPMQSCGRALWLELPRALRRRVESESFVWRGALHGVGHLLVAVVPLVVRCDAGDLNTEHYNPFETRARAPRVTVYERRAGGSGIVEEAARRLREVVRRAWRIARECDCARGCPSCIHSAQCTEYNKVLDKRGALMVLAFVAAALGVDDDDDDADDHDERR